MISYRIDVHNAQAHLYRVTLSIPAPAVAQRLSLPVWIPGSYLVREFARHLSALEAKQGSRAVTLTQVDKATWQAECRGRAALVVTYLVYAFDTSVRAAFLDAQRGFFNGTSLCLRVEGREAEPHRIELRSLPRSWQVATSMAARAASVFEASDYDELVDHPFELGAFWRGRFTAHGVPHELVVTGALPDFDGERLLADTRRICDAEIAFWHGEAPKRADVPFERYVFLLNAVDDGYGGLEHRASTALIASRRDLPRGVVKGATPEALTDGYVTLLGLISHEYFHTWNVKRLKPRDFAPYDYTRENYTELLWFFEGFTSYYDDLFLLRSGLIDEARFLKGIGKTLGNVLGMPGRQVQSVAQASFDAWVKYYRTDENTPNATISYYTKGSLVALALDLSLRSTASRRKGTLDDVMRRLWARSAGGAIAESDIVEVLREVAGPARADMLAQQLSEWVHGTGDLPLPTLLKKFGVQWQAQPPTLAQRLGVRVSESALTGIKVTHVLRGGAGERAGLSSGDEVLALGDWRLRRLDDALRLMSPGRAATLLVSRDQRLLTLSLDVPEPADAAGSVVLAVDAQASRDALALRTAWTAG
ncbi:MAG: PDZ domain-containing protein [Pseudomonadota bacterium]|nr:PDZ domain-containing protein [Pseudomonadota bacterium]